MWLMLYWISLCNSILCFIQTGGHNSKVSKYAETGNCSDKHAGKYDKSSYTNKGRGLWHCNCSTRKCWCNHAFRRNCPRKVSFCVCLVASSFYFLFILSLYYNSRCINFQIYASATIMPLSCGLSFFVVFFGCMLLSFL